MKKIIRDIVVVALLFALVLAVPLLTEEFSSDVVPAAKPATKVAPSTPEVTATKAPPMPEPYNDQRPIEVMRGGGEQPEVAASDSDCTFMGSRSYFASTSRVLESGGDSFIFGGAEDKDSAPAGPSFDGGGGTDTVDLRGMGTLVIDGTKLKSIEVIKVRNGVPNVVKVLARGLSGTSGRHIVIDGDTSDEAVLPSCLNWAEPEPVTVGDVNYMRYEATDAGGLKAAVSVSSEMRVEKR